METSAITVHLVVKFAYFADVCHALFFAVCSCVSTCVGFSTDSQACLAAKLCPTSVTGNCMLSTIGNCKLFDC